MKEKIERLRKTLKDRFENLQAMRIALEQAGDSKNALTFKEREVEARVALGLFTDVFPESSEG